MLLRRAVSTTAPAPPPPSAAGQVATSLTSFSDPVYDMMSQVRTPNVLTIMEHAPYSPVLPLSASKKLSAVWKLSWLPCSACC